MKVAVSERPQTRKGTRALNGVGRRLENKGQARPLDERGIQVGGDVDDKAAVELQLLQRLRLPPLHSRRVTGNRQATARSREQHRYRAPSTNAVAAKPCRTPSRPRRESGSGGMP